MNKFLAVMVWVLGYIGASKIMWVFVPRGMELDIGGNWGFLTLVFVLVFMPLWLCVVKAAGRLWKMEGAK